jgi:beta-fructofuranosidase
LVFAGKLVVESGAQSLPGFDLQAGGLEVVLSVDLAQGAAGEFGLRFRDVQSGECIAVGVRDHGRELFLDTTGASWGNEGVFCSILDAPQEKLEIRIFLDRSSIEVFCDGAASITARIYPSSFQLVPELFAAGGMLQVRNLEVWNIGVGS